MSSFTFFISLVLISLYPADEFFRLDIIVDTSFSFVGLRNKERVLAFFMNEQGSSLWSRIVSVVFLPSLRKNG